MKLIVAMIRSDRLQAIQEALTEPEAYIMYISSVGDIRETITGTYRGTEYAEPRPRLRLEIVVVNDLFLQDTIEVVARIACAPNPEGASSGSIFVMPLEDWIQLRANRPTPVSNGQEVQYSGREAS